MGKMAKELDILDRLLKRIGIENLGLNHTRFNDENCSQMSPRRKRWGCSMPQSFYLVVQEVFFTVKAVVNYHNDRVNSTLPGNILEHTSSDKNKLVSWFRILLLLMVWKPPWCSLKKEWKWIVELTSTQSSAPTHVANLMQKRDILIDFFAKSIWPLSILCTLQYDTFWRAMFHIFHIQVCQSWKKLLWYGISLRKEVVKSSCTSVEKRLRAIVKAKYGHFEL